jgi:primary-amine oxidase
MTASHPLDPLSAEEISSVVHILRAHYHDVKPDARLAYKFITLQEPPKKHLVEWLDSKDRASLSAIPRTADVLVGVKDGIDSAFVEHVVNISDGTVVLSTSVDPASHPGGDLDEGNAVEKAVLDHPQFKEEIAKLKLPEQAVVCGDVWIYGKCEDESHDTVWRRPS